MFNQSIVKISGDVFNKYIDVVIRDKRWRSVESVNNMLVLAMSNFAATQLRKTPIEMIGNYYSTRPEFGYESVNLDSQLVIPNVQHNNLNDFENLDFLHFKAIGKSNVLPLWIEITNSGQIQQINRYLVVDENNAPLAYDTVVEYVSQSKLNLQLLNVFRKRYGISIIECGNVFGINLTNLEEIVVSCLLARFTLNEIAELQNVSRDYIKTIITDKLCEKFGVSGGSINFLRERLIDLGYFHFIPSLLMNSKPKEPLPSYNRDCLNSREQIILDMMSSYFTQQEIADKIGVSRSLVARIIATRITPITSKINNHASL